MKPDPHKRHGTIRTVIHWYWLKNGVISHSVYQPQTEHTTRMFRVYLKCRLPTSGLWARGRDITPSERRTSVHCKDSCNYSWVATPFLGAGDVLLSSNSRNTAHLSTTTGYVCILLHYESLLAQAHVGKSNDDAARKNVSNTRHGVLLEF